MCKMGVVRTVCFACMGIKYVVDTTRREVAQSVERRTLEVEVRGSKPMLGIWWWGRIPPSQPYPKGVASAATTIILA